MALHIYRADKISRVRVDCPYCGHLCYGDRHDYYDGWYYFLDCGTQINPEYWKPPPKKKCRYCCKWFEPFDMIKHLRDYHRIIVWNLK